MKNVKNVLIGIFIFNLLNISTAFSSTNVTLYWSVTNTNNIKGYKIYYYYKNQSKAKVACQTSNSFITKLTCSNVQIEKYPVYFFVAAELGNEEVRSKPKKFYPPASINNFSATSDIKKILLSWINPSKSDFKGVLIRYNTVTKNLCDPSDFPSDPTKGKLLGDFPGVLGESKSYAHANLDPKLTYCYAAFSYDGFRNYTHTAHIYAKPLDANSHAPSITMFKVSPTHLDNPQTPINFLLQASDPDGDALSFKIDFGDGEFTNKQSGTHIYKNKKQYWIKANVTDSNGNIATKSVLIKVDDKRPAKVGALKIKVKK